MSEQHLYFAACAENGGIYHFIVESSGAIRFCEKTPVDRPMYLAIEDDRLYVLLRGTNELGADGIHSALVSYQLDEKGTPCSPSPVVPTQGLCACHLDVVDGTVYVVNYLSGNVIRMPDKVVTHEGHSIHPTRQEAPHTHFVKRTPDGKYLFVVDLGLDTIFTYDRDLNCLHTVKAPSGSGCRHLAYSEDGHTVFCANELGSSVSVYAYHDGQLTLKNTYPALPDHFKGESTAAAIRVAGNQLYISNRGHDSITRFCISGETLTYMECTPCGGKSPRDFNIFGNLMMCTNELSDNVTVLRLENGKPELIPVEFKMPHPLCVIAK